MTPIETMENIAKFIRGSIDGYSANSSKGEIIAIEVYAGFMPTKTSSQETPSCIYVLLESLEDSSDDTLSTCKIEIGFSIRDADETEGWRSLYNALEHVRHKRTPIPS